jgi:hemerythrin-like domain-containing protein
MLCLRIRRALALPNVLTVARETADQAARFLATDLAAHFKAEEEALFPKMRNFPAASKLLSELLTERRMLEALAERLSDKEETELVRTLVQFADLLEAHIRKEERELFPLYESTVSDEAAAEVDCAVKAVIGDGTGSRENVSKPFS